MKNRRPFFLLTCLSLLMIACTPEPPMPEGVPVTDPVQNPTYSGFYLLNEGTMGANKAILDYFDYATGYYQNDVFSKRNPQVVDGLGDVGTGLYVYGSKMYAIINGSNLVEVMDAKTATHLASLQIPNARSAAFANGKAYFSSYAGQMQTDGTQLGFVIEVDTVSLMLGRQVTVGRQPEEMVVKDGKLFVANSGGYTPENYDNTISVVNMDSFVEEEKIPVAINLYRMFLAPNGTLYVSSRGNYADVAPNLYAVNTMDKTVKALGKGVTAYAIKDGVAYIIDIVYGPAPLYQTEYHYYTLQLNTQQIDNSSFLSDDVKKQIVYPYSIAVHPITGDILVTDAANFVTPGTLFYCNVQGQLQWKQTTGDIPGSIAFWQ